MLYGGLWALAPRKKHSSIFLNICRKVPYGEMPEKDSIVPGTHGITKIQSNIF